MFKPGDLVRCDHTVHGNETVGKVYVVAECDPRETWFFVEKDDNGIKNCYSKENFSLVQEKRVRNRFKDSNIA